MIFLVEESVEGECETKAPAESIYTEANTLKGLRKAVTHAVRRHSEETDRPHPEWLHYVKDEVVAV